MTIHNEADCRHQTSSYWGEN